ncbi:hypothetical protein GCM10008956_32330 [Deinococcus arenae]|uniref:site-specific DNA-methyltransferase (adenine-specific) n=1 Tax=Deinococcus arenae TaxID=1452751 RepID=A0A8H9LCM5_9DEIO|nr:class I SAM-dependent DNA methyltransferase [Deinococcus arenae]GGM53895.1 hypothetical protein GCM10008956_32330 [Deinococcus arenae]
MTNNRMGNLIWAVAELLRGDFKQADYGKIILPMTIARRLDGVCEERRADVDAIIAAEGENASPELLRYAAKGPVYNVTGLSFQKMVNDPANLAENLMRFSGGFPEDIREIFQRYRFTEKIKDLEEKGLLLAVATRFASLDLSPQAVSNEEMGHAFEDLIRRFSELSNETAGEHYTPREVVNLMVQLLFTEDDDVLSQPGTIKKVYDPTGGTGAMLSSADDYVTAANPDAKLALFGQELNDESYAIFKADMLIKGHNPEHIKQGNTLTEDKHPNLTVDYVLSNPPFGVDWGKAQDAVLKERKAKGHSGRFGPGLPRKSDGTFLFMLHGLSKLNDTGRMGIVTNGSPLFTGNAGSGESEIRRHLIENDLIEAIIALPTDMFYNTGIQTYVWLLSRQKTAERKGKIQLIDASKLVEKMPKSLGSKRNRMSPDHVARVVQAHGTMEESAISKVVEGKAFGYRTITVDRPMRHNYAATPERLERLRSEKKFRLRDDLDAIIAALREKVGAEPIQSRATFQGRIQLALGAWQFKATELKAIVDLLADRDETAEPTRDSKKRVLPDTDLRDTEDVPLLEDVQDYFQREVLAQTPDAWINEDVTDEKDGQPGKVGYEIPFNRYFYTYEAPPALDEIDARIKARSARIMQMLTEVIG